MTRSKNLRLQTQTTIAFTLFALTSTSFAAPQNRSRFEGAPKAKAPAAPIKAKPAAPRTTDPDDENTINVTLETGDEELDHTLGASEDQIAKSRAAAEANLGPRNGRTGTNSKLISRALSYRGARYRFGASGTNGVFDCSSFVQHLMQGEGVSLPRTAREQFGQGKKISRSELQPGDIVFFAGTYRSGISHVGMYVGNGMFVHAASSKRGVVMDPLDLPYYNSKYAGARRFK
ncbi:C40 family peptidase [Armatimonas rosea]|uniref:Cell wall-associated NlpC family hydrolase n=1 Tax=Armatimonas rosea TaxID=685828 RepID=A0A7W9SW96_ARMRO|nr:C40 family peptidase [Armatimonas rosea]MBB6053379.1 cell wall-associated NlpC family hydrolase [Armatimonas rosea]